MVQYFAQFSDPSTSLTNGAAVLINKEFEAKLLNEKSIPFSFDKDWSSKFANEPGVYGIFDKTRTFSDFL